MTEIEVTNSSLIIRIEGVHKLLALKSYLEVPLDHVVGIELDPETARKGWSSKSFWGLRLGTHLPGRLKAGRFHEGEGWSFWSVGDPHKAVLVHLNNERYERMVLEVSDPPSTVAAVKQAKGEL